MSAGKFLPLWTISLITIVVSVGFAVVDEQSSQENFYAQDEILVKFKKPAADVLEQGFKAGDKAHMQKLPVSLENINRKYNVKSIEPVFRNFKAARNRIEFIKSKRIWALTGQERKLQRRLARAPKGAKIPDLDRIYRIKLEGCRSLEKVLESFKNDPSVEYAQLNYLQTLYYEPNDPCYPLQWALSNVGQLYPWDGRYNEPPGIKDADIDANEAWDVYTAKSEVVVAVIDTGIDYNHRDLQNIMWTDANGYYGYDFSNDDTDPADYYGHGTHCAGIVSADFDNGTDIAGVCPQTKIMAVKIFPNAYDDVCADGIRYAADNGADILSCSWGPRYVRPSAPVIEEAIDYAHSLGCVVVFSAGNHGKNVENYSPANYSKTIAVVATNSNDQKPSFSDYGELADIAAPGVDILSLRAAGKDMGGNATVYDDYTLISSGTSMACPHVAGACALALSYNPTLSNQEIRELLNETVDIIFDPNDYICASNGRLNINNALLAAHPSKGHVTLDRDYYQCSSNIFIRLGDYDLQGINDVNVILTTDIGGDEETVTLDEQTPGVFTGTISSEPNEPVVQGDGMLQVSDGEIIAVTYEDANDGTGNPASPNDTAIIDCTYPVISDVNYQDPVIGSQQIITFETDELTTARIECGTSCGESDIIEAEDNELKLSHTFSFTHTDPQGEMTEYFFTIEATDQAGNTILDSNDGNCYKYTRRDITVPTDYNTIQEAIDASSNGDVIVVLPGTYYENPDLNNKNITLTSTDPYDWDVVKATVIDGNGATNTVTIRGQYTDDCTFTGFTVTGGTCGLAVTNYYSSTTISNCIIRNNTETGIEQNSSFAIITNCVIKNNGIEAVYVNSSGPTIKNSLIHNNGAGIVVNDSSTVEIYNCTIVNNNSYGVVKNTPLNDIFIWNCILWNNVDDLSDCTATYSCISDGDVGIGNIDDDPCFVNGDELYHLQSISPCINAGDDDDYSGELDIDSEQRVIGYGVDMGADEVGRVYNETQEIWYDSINDAVDDASNGDVIILSPDTYYENIHLQDKGLTIRSVDPNDWDVVNDTVIDGNGVTNTIMLFFYTNATNLRGLTITGGSRGIYLNNSGSNVTVSNCIIRHNTDKGIMTYQTGSNTTFKNCIIRNNLDEGIYLEAGTISVKNNLIRNNGTGVFLYGGVNASVHNCTIVDNDSYGINKAENGNSINVKNCIVWDNGDDLYNCSATYSCIEDGDAGTGNISSDPCFVDADSNDFHLQLDSPCIGAGDEGVYDDELDIDNQPRVMGTNIEMGADEALKGVYNETQKIWYDTINEAIDDANNSDVIVAMPDTYYENIEFGDKNLTIKSTDPNDWEIVESTLIDGNGASDTVFFDFGNNGTLRGFTITGGNRGIRTGYANPVAVSNCIIRDNNIGIRLYTYVVSLENCIIKDNTNEGVILEAILSGSKIKNNLIYNNGKGIFVYGGVTADIHNCTIVNNSVYGIMAPEEQWNNEDIKNCIIWGNGEDLDNCEAAYSWVTDDGDPCFVDADSNDFHLRVYSPCVNAGDPNGNYNGQTDIDSEPRLMGDSVDIGADEIRRVYNETQQVWYDGIKEAVNDANDGDVIILTPDTYYESFYINELALLHSGKYKGLEIRGTNPYDWDVVNDTVINGNAATNTVMLGFASKGSSLRGLTITGGDRGIYLWNSGSNITVSNCIIRHNTDRGIMTYQTGSNTTFRNCIIRDNDDEGIYLEAGTISVKNNLIRNNGTGVFLYGGVNASVHNCTIVDNDSYGINKAENGNSINVKNCIVWDNGDDLYNCSATYSCIEDGDAGTGNISSDPCFVPSDGQYHLQLHSPCVEGGDPNGNYDGQTDIDDDDRVIGGNADMGADEVLLSPDSHWWKLDEGSGVTAYDTIDTDDGTFNGTDPCWVDGLFGGAVDFNGISDYFSVSTLDSEYTNGDSFTVTGWFRTDVSTGLKTIVGQWAQDEYEVYPGHYDDFYSGWQVLVGGKKVRARSGISNTTATITGATDVNDNYWHHFAFVHPSYPSSSSLYVDGDLDAEPGNLYWGSGGTKFRIGDGSYVISGAPEVKGGPFNGTIDNIMIFDRALTADEINQLYEEGL